MEVSDIEIEGEHSIVFDRSVINKSFAPVSTGKLNLRWVDAKSAFILEPVLDDGSAADNVFILVTPSF